MSNRLLVNPGTPQAWEIRLKPGLNRIGRGADNDFVINHQSISTHHCEIDVTDTGVTLRDRGSTNGTFVNRIPVAEHQIQNGQHIQFGAVDTVFESSALPVLPDAVNLPADGARIVVANPGPAAPPLPPPPPPAPTGGLRLSRAESSHAPAAAAPSAPPRPMAPLVRQPKTHEEFEAERAATDRKMFVRGLAGGILGAFVGMLGWYLLIKWTHMEIGYAALLVGAVTGAGARLLARQGSALQGILCAVLALVAIVGGQYFALVSIIDKELEWEIGKDYKKEIDWANSAMVATNLDEIVFLISVRDDINSSRVTEADVKEFRERDLPRYRDLLKGKPTKEEYIAAEMATYPKPALSESIGLFTILWSVFGIAAAWRIGSGGAG